MDVSNIMGTLVTLGTTWGGRIIGVLVVLWIASKLSKTLSHSVSQRLERRNFDVTLTRFFSNMIRYAILVGATLGCLGVFGIETTSFAALIAAMGLAVGMALQGTLGNFAAGVMLLVFRPYKVGDLIQTDGHLGIVETLELFTTVLKTLDNRRLIIPNGAIFGKTIENLTHYPLRRVDISVGATYSDNIAHTREVLEGCLGNIVGALEDPAPQIFLKELGSSSVDWEVRVWCQTDQYWDVYQDTIRAVKEAMDGAKVGIPFPQMDVHFDDKIVSLLAGKAPRAG